MKQGSHKTLLINIGHSYAHLFMLIFPTAVIAMEADFEASYAALLSLSTGGFIAFGAGALPAGWLGDRWSREGMMVVFFLGLGAAAIATGLATSTTGLALGLFFIGAAASIWHPVGIAALVQGQSKVGVRLGVTGVFGNMGVAGAGLCAGLLTDTFGWRAAFIAPGMVAIATGLLFAVLVPRRVAAGRPQETSGATPARPDRNRVLAVVAVATLLGGIIFHGTTVAMPKLYDERAGELLGGLSGIGFAVAAVFAIAAFAQIAIGYLIDRYPIRPVLIAIVGLQLPALVAVAALDGWPLIVVTLVLMLLVFGEIPISDTLIARYAADRHRGRIYAVKYVLSLGVSASAIPLIAGVHAWAGFGALYVVLAALGLALSLAAIALPRRNVPLAPSTQGVA